MIIKVGLKFLLKIFTYKNGASVTFSFLSSLLVSLGINKYTEWFMHGADKKIIYMPMFVETVMFIPFLFICTMDLRYGSKVAIEKKGEDFNWDRVWDTVSKIFAILFITSMLVVFSMVFESLQSRYLWWITFIPLCFLWVLAISFEFGSLGRHIGELRGNKPEIFVFFDRLLEVLQTSALNRVKDTIDNVKQEDIKNK